MFRWTLRQIKTILDLRVDRMRQHGDSSDGKDYTGTMYDLKSFFG